MHTKTLLVLILSLFAATGCPRNEMSVNPGRAMEETVRGVDVSHHNGSIDWDAVATEDGMRFVFIKATEGTTLVDGMYQENRTAARAAGLMVGAYHFLTTASDAESQFDNFRRVVKKEDIDLVPVLDAERMTKGHPMSDADYVRHVGKWIGLCKEHYGVAPILYCSRDHYRKYFKSRFKDCLFWCGDVDATRGYVDAEPWIIWQESIRECSGSPSRLDIDVLAPDTDLQDISLKQVPGI